MSNLHFKEFEIQEVEDFIDEFISKWPSYNEYFVYDILVDTMKTDKGVYLYNLARFLLVQRGIIKTGGAFDELTDYGRQIKSKGGYKKYLEEINSLERKQKYRTELELKNLEITTDLNKWLYKTKWLPHILSILAFLISIAAVIIAYLDYTKKE
ncbi:hypothetical protein [Flavobacterium sp. CAU 1735]|uniref:hypothetical protein n=1 Tax=Flavobacterium sp. CAU 1735 TaxID=3140361 RepID=UPI00326045BC